MVVRPRPSTIRVVVVLCCSFGGGSLLVVRAILSDRRPAARTDAHIQAKEAAVHGQQPGTGHHIV